jgi:hypothetical protein
VTVFFKCPILYKNLTRFLIIWILLLFRCEEANRSEDNYYWKNGLLYSQIPQKGACLNTEGHWGSFRVSQGGGNRETVVCYSFCGKEQGQVG